MRNFDVRYLKELVRALSAGESVPAALRNECHRLMMAVDGNKLALIEECVGRIRHLAQQEGYALPVNSPPPSYKPEPESNLHTSVQGGTDDVKSGYELKLQCIDCGVTFGWAVLPRQLLTANTIKPIRCPSCRRAKRERVKKTRRRVQLRR